ncbi:hypothetical protein NWF24_30825 [Variovorax paradoxus]|uniref:C1 family peptidase n=1 Tax=Variovorax paradoxus TaxID=34073 RepID=UPI0021ACA503|nr:C1 family peptidase [Variovorax paradoxus]UVH57184.1 hypothetical protein NWF24_30825 [Variovorax paradoxus]
MAFTASDLNRAVSGAGDMLSPEFLYSSAGTLTPGWTPGMGLYAWAAMDAIHAIGQPFEVDYPYKASDPATAATPTAPAGKPMFTSDLAGHSSSMQSIVDRLNDGHPVGLVIRVTDTLYTPVGGVVDASGGIVQGFYHAVLATGWGESKATGRHLRIRNSWGPMWGELGYAWLPEKFVDLHVLEAFGSK